MRRLQRLRLAGQQPKPGKAQAQKTISAAFPHPMNVDFLIVGQGLAGSLLTWELSQRGQQVMAVDSGEENASLISAGIVNPVTGMRWVKTAQADILLPAARKYYADLSAYFGHEFFIEKPMLRIFKDAAEVEQCRKKLAQSGYAGYLGELDPASRELYGFHAPYGAVEQKQTGHLLTFDLLDTLKQWLLSRNWLRLTKFDYASISLNANSVSWQDVNAKHIIFCEGHLAMENPWFGGLPFKPAKGEILTVQTAFALPNHILSYGHWLLPTAENTARIGATFEWDFADTTPTPHGKATLLKQLATYDPTASAWPILGHNAGIRPCTQDRQPFLGRHPGYPQLAIFNGFGSKGSLLIPWHAQRFADFLVNNTPLPAACDSRRYPLHHLAG